MSRAKKSLALAASSYNGSRENRLTEVLATVLQTHNGFANKLLAKLDLGDAVEVRAWTQDKQVDLVLRADGLSGRTVVYSENKEPGGGWQEGQPGKYLASLRQEIRDGAHGALLALVGTPSDAVGRARRLSGTGAAVSPAAELADLMEATDDELMRYETWQQLGGWAFEAGREAAHSDSSWLERAGDPGERADQRLLAELIWYLEGEGYVVTRPIQDEDFQLAVAVSDFTASIKALLEDVESRLCDPTDGLGLTKKADGDLKPPSGSWIERYRGAFYLNWVPLEGDPAGLGFEFGAWVNRSGDRAAETKVQWRSQTKDAGLVFDDGVISATFDAGPLKGMPTLSHQAEAVTEWARSQGELILQLDPARDGRLGP